MVYAGGGLNSDNNSSKSSGKAFHSGIFLPLSRELTTSIALASLPNENYAETQVFWNRGFDLSWLKGFLTLQASALKGDEGSMGNTQQLTYSNGFSLTAYRNQANNASCGNSSQQRSFSRIGCAETAGASLSIPLYAWMLNIGYSQSINTTSYYDAVNPEQNFGTARVNAVNAKSTINTWQLSGARTDAFRDLNISTRLGIFRRDDGNDNGGYIGFTVSRSSAARKNYTSISGEYRSQNQRRSEFNWAGSHSWYGDDSSVMINAGRSGENSYNAMLQGYSRGIYGEINNTVSTYYDGQSKETSNAYTGGYNSSLTVAKSGVFLGPASYMDGSAVVIARVESLDEENNGSQVDLITNEKRLTLKEKRSIALPLPAYTKGNVQVEESIVNVNTAQTEVIKGGGGREYFMLPGKSITRNIEVQSNYTYIGRLLHTNGIPLVAKSVLNKALFTIGGKGEFSIDTTQRISDLYVINNYDIYQCPLSVKVKRDVINYVDDVICKSIIFADLPKHFQDIASLKLFNKTSQDTLLSKW